MTTTSESHRNAGRLPEGLVYPELVSTGITETLVQMSDAFNAASNGAIRLVPDFNRGDFVQESFFQTIGNLVERREVASSPDNPTVTPKELTMEEKVSPTINRRIGPVESTLDSFRKIGQRQGPEVLSLALGEQVAKAVAVDWLDTALRAVVGATLGVAGQQVAAASPNVITTNRLVDLLAIYGDVALSRVRAFVMHSSVYFELVKDQIGNNIYGISNFNVQTGTPVTLGKPVIVTDSAALLTDASPEPTDYVTLALVEDAAMVMQAQPAPIFDTHVEHGRSNLVVSYQGEHDYQVGVKGYAYQAATSGINPADATLVDSASWSNVATDNKDLGAALLVTRG